MKCDEMMGKVNEGQRMEAPARCPPAVYDVMMLCWHKDPESRPSFQRLCEYIEKIRKNVCIIIDGRGDVSNDDDDNDSINKLPVWHYNGNYAIEEDSV
ncbi:tyrosine-protein kinase CSK-like [Ylistrum balloti]|uniref:tyrosine-protein kinase CSK-like n=1 Tax=Ylistrum balloti TaxID=509963 RepID=UPI0029059F6B|nr:tyrosine-protein kinase CSK-like [Ylistrum balloti]